VDSVRAAQGYENEGASCGGRADSGLAGRYAVVSDCFRVDILLELSHAHDQV